MGIAGSQLQAADRSGQRRTSTGSSRLQWAALGLNRGARERSGQRRTSPGELGQRRTSPARKKMPEDMSEDMSENDMSENDMSEEMSIEM